MPRTARVSPHGERARDPPSHLATRAEHGAGGLPDARARPRDGLLHRPQVHADHDRQRHADSRRIGAAAGLSGPPSLSVRCRKASCRISSRVPSADPLSPSSCRRSPTTKPATTNAGAFASCWTHSPRQDRGERSHELAAAAGWFVVHIFWIGAVIGGLAAVLLTMLGDRRARLRHALAYAGLMLTILLPLAITLGTVDFFSRAARVQATGLVERAIGMPAFVVWRGYVVRGAAIAWVAGLVIVTIRVAAARRRGATLRRTDTTRARLLAAADGREAPRRSRCHATRDRAGFTARRSADGVRLAARRPSCCQLAPADDLNTTQLTAVLAHELAHVRRRDYARIWCRSRQT